MNERKIIIVLSIICCISIGIAVYFARSGSINHANELRANYDKLRSEHAEQGRNLEDVLAKLGDATTAANELGDTVGRARELAQSAGESINELRTTALEAGGTIQQLIYNHRRIAEGVGQLQRNNNELKATLGISD